MGSEYVRLSYPERAYGQRNFLQAQLEILDLARGMQVYKKLRMDELVLKVTLKTLIHEVKTLIDKFDRYLPHVKYKAKKVEPGEEKEEWVDLSLEEEIERVRRKLEKLGGGEE